MSRERRTIGLAMGMAVLVGVLSARGGDAKPSGDVEPGFGKGRVTNLDGEPIAGVAISLENTIFLGHAQTKTDKDGRYHVELARGSWHVTARLTKLYHGTRYVMDCAPRWDDDFQGQGGGVRDFVFKLTGEKPEARGYYGSPVVIYREIMNFDFEEKDVELTLTPDGPLIDGSIGKPITAKPKHTGDGWCIQDVAVGRYKIVARLKPKKGSAGEPLRIKVRNGDDDYAESVTADFIHNGPLDSLFKLDVEVKK